MPAAHVAIGQLADRAMIKLRPMGYGATFDSVRVLGGLLAPDDMTWTTETLAGAPALPFVLHLSCMVHYTPHIPYIAQKILAKLGIECPIFGGPENCCGAIHRHLGDPKFAAATARIAIAGFRRVRPTTVLSVCPDCDEAFGEHMPENKLFHHSNISELFVTHLGRLQSMMRPLERRVILHTHGNNESRARDARNIWTILAAIPGVELLNAQHHQGRGTHCQILEPMPADKRAAMFSEAMDLDADTVVMPYHSCYRQHIKWELEYSLKVEHYLSILAAALEIDVAETYKELRLLGDVDRAVDALRPRFEPRGYTREQIRPLVASAVYC